MSADGSDPRYVYATGGFALVTVTKPTLEDALRVKTHTLEYHKGRGMTPDDVEVWGVPVTEGLTFEPLDPKRVRPTR